MDLGSSSRTPQASSFSEIEAEAFQVNDSMYVLYKPEGMPSMQVVFFHGLQLLEDYSNAHLSTWESHDGSCIWPQKWLVEEFPDAEIVSMSYSIWIGKNANKSVDMYNIGENLVYDILQEGIGQTSHCPVILVGHSIGGLIVKQLCSEAHDRHHKKHGMHKDRLEIFLKNIRGIFFYGTPHHGSLATKELVDSIGDPLLKYVETLSKDTARLNEKFEDIKQVYKWSVAGLGETLPTKLGPDLSIMITPEASARCDNFNTVENVDHISICKPVDKTARSFRTLKDFLVYIAKNMEEEVKIFEENGAKEEAKESHQCQGLPDYPVELETRSQDVIEKLNGGAILGIFGMGGIGKTTLAKQVFNNISKDFEYTSFVDNVKLTNLDQLEDRLLTHLQRNGLTSHKIQWPNLKDMKTLIVMDGIDAEDQLKLLPKFQHFGKGSCLIMTSRDKELFKFYKNCIVYEVGFLEEVHAMKLFCQNAFGSDEIPDLLREVVKKVVKKCGGLPLTLEVMGRYLRGHTTDIQVWEQSLERLGNAQSITGGRNDKVWASLRVSYDTLSQEEQEIFIEAATVFQGSALEEAHAGWSSSTRHAETTWRNLVNRSLVREVDELVWRNWTQFFMQSKVVWVHEQLLDLAEKISPGQMLFGLEKDANLVVDQINRNKVELQPIYLQLFYSYPVGHREILRLDKLARMKRLKYMHLNRVLWKGRAQGLTSDLAILKWTGCTKPRHHSLFWSCASFSPRRLQTFPINAKEMKNLAILELREFVVGKNFAEALGYLANLRFLVLDGLEGLDQLPENFGNLVLLKRLIVKSLRSLKLPESFGNLKALEQLALHDIEGLDRLPDNVGNLASLKDLEIINCPMIKYLPQSFSRLSKLQRLYIYECGGLEALDDAFNNLSSLRQLHLLQVGVLPASIWRLPALQELDLSSNKLKTSSDIIFHLVHLVNLTICFDELDKLPENFYLLKSLRELRIDCPKLERLPERLGELALIEVLELSLRSVHSLPESTGKLSSLRELKFVSRSAKLLPESLGQLSSLKTLTLECHNLEKLPDSLVELSSMEKLTISAKKLECLPENIGCLQSLRKLALNVRSVTILPESIGRSLSLREFQFDCSGHEEKSNFESLSSFAQNLVLAGGWNSTKLPAGLGCLSSLRFLTLKTFRDLERLPGRTWRAHVSRKSLN